jgi:hypothetical protein
LNAICKSYGRNKKTEKEKEKRKEKYEMDPGKTFQPSREKEPAAQEALYRTGTLLFAHFH